MEFKKFVLEYKMEIDNKKRMYVPGWIEDGGYFFNPNNYTYIGISPIIREYKIPDTVKKHTYETLKERIYGLSIKKTVDDKNIRYENEMTKEEKDEMLEKFLKDRGVL